MVSVTQGVKRLVQLSLTCANVFSHLFRSMGVKGMTLLNSCLSAKELGLSLRFEFCGKQLNYVGPWPYKLLLTA